MLFYSYFKTLVGKEVSGVTSAGGEERRDAAAAAACCGPLQHHYRTVSPTLLLPPHPTQTQVTVELKNDLAITGVLHSVDQYLNIKLTSTRVVDEAKYPHMMSVRNCFIRGSVVRYVHVSGRGAMAGFSVGLGFEVHAWIMQSRGMCARQHCRQAAALRATHILHSL